MSDFNMNYFSSKDDMIAAMLSRIEELERVRDVALNAVIKLGDRLQRECFGLNNEGDPIGGDHPVGWKPRAEKAEERLTVMETELAAEKALADHAYEVAVGADIMPLFCAAYRKARGM